MISWCWDNTHIKEELWQQISTDMTKGNDSVQQ